MKEFSTAIAQKPIAIIGMSCRFPGADNYNEFWKNLMKGQSGISEIPLERWNWRHYSKDFPGNGDAGKWGGFIKDASSFDASFFQLSGKEAELMDPQQRIMLELTWNCLEDAGIPPSKLSGSNTGVFVGVFNHDYKELVERSSSIEAHYGTGTSAAIVANRLSYFYNFKGPSVPIDTACSASLQAMHMAAQSIQVGECDLALAGGISLLFTPAKHIAFGKTGMLSPTGSCKSFDERADGYVRSEGAGVLLLKSLEKALEDGDVIYGVLRGSAVNHCGKTFTLTYPSPSAQAEVIAAAVKRSGVIPGTISYIETHGTGTPKGDPIEIEGLIKAFTTHLEGSAINNYCGVGSLKANIGHLESAAGIAGVIKVLLAMKHQQLPGLLHFQQLNTRISLHNTPFYIVDKPRSWLPLFDEQGQTYPRRAGVSSFGFGGTNAHAVLEESPISARTIPAKQPAYIICLSAKNREGLRQRKAELAAWINLNRASVNIADLSYTLLLGREHFQTREAIVVTDIDSLLSALHIDQYENDKTEKVLSPTQQQEADRILSDWNANGNTTAYEYTVMLKQLAEAYALGYNGNWALIFHNSGAIRITLPGYPFQKTRHWVQASSLPAYSKPLDQEATVVTTSDLSTSIVLTGDECFLKDHVFKDQKILPAVVYMEVVRNSVQQLVKEMSSADIICLKNLVWMVPVIVNKDSVKLHVNFTRKETGNSNLHYEVFSEDTLHNKIIHGCGMVYIEQVNELSVYDVPGVTIEDALYSFEGEHFYSLLKAAGFSYGPSHQKIDQLYIYDDKIVARLKTANTPEPEIASFFLHPGYMDAALQATMGRLFAMATDGIPVKIPLPFSMQEVKVFASCNNAKWIIVHTGKDNSYNSPMDIDLFDANGNLCVRMKGFSGRTVKKPAETIDITNDADLCKLETFWTEKQHTSDQKIHEFENHIVLFCEGVLQAQTLTDPRWQSINYDILESKQTAIDKKFSYYCWKLLEIIKELAAKSHGKILLQLVVGTDDSNRHLSGLKGLLNSASVEYPKFHTQVIEWPSEAGSAGLLASILKDKVHVDDRHIRYQGGQRLVPCWRYVDEAKSIQNPWRNDGVYLVTGGMGGLGLVFAGEIARKAPRATIILTGRSQLSAENELRLHALRTKTGTIIYKQLDVTNVQGVRETMDWIKNKFGKLNAVLHTAGIVQDNYIIKKTQNEMEETLAPKVAGLINLDEALVDMKLDFLALFSSTSGVLGNIGQVDYSAANTFMDEYARYRNTLLQQGLRSGKTISISWPFWKEGGMRLTDANIAALSRNTGMMPLQTQEGINAFYSVLQSEQDHVLVMKGNAEVLTKKLYCDFNREKLEVSHHKHLNELKMTHDGDIKTEIIRTLVHIASDILKSSPTDIDSKAPLDEYGFDSILYTEFALKLNEIYECDITPTLFFQYTTIAELADYLGSITGTTKPSANGAGQKIEYPSEALQNQDNDSLNKVDIAQRLTSVLCEYAAEVLEVPVTDIDPNAGMDEYSFDSIHYTGIAIKVNENFDLEMAPTIFFECATLKSLAEHLLRQSPSSFEEKFSSNEVYREQLNGVSQTAAPKSTGTHEATNIETSTSTDPSTVPIAIIGVSGSFPMSEDIEELWKNLIEERDCISEIPADRWDWNRHFGNAASEQGKTNIKWGGFVKDLNAFDASFFNISPGEAAYMDPQQRLLLMHVWKALEDAGYAPQDFYGSNTALFTGIASHEYSARVSKMNLKTEVYHQSSIVSCIGPNRVSYFLNLHGTSEPVDTACSSSLVAIHRAVREIRSGDCDTAIAGGVTALSSLPSYISFDKAGMLAKDGRCKTFSDQANGYARAEGVGVFLLKRLDAAERDGDHIYGLIKSTAVNHGGRANSLSAPNMRAQAALLKTAYTKGGVDPRTIGYVEAHGTGTKIGDPIEIDALKAAFKELYKETGEEEIKDAHCGIGSIKTNIGHTEYAAGMAGVIKVLLQMKYQLLVKTLHCDTINPYIDLKNSPFYIVRETQKWKPMLDGQGKQLPRRAGISSFGFGGVNSHVIIEEYVDRRTHEQASDSNRSHPFIFILSAKKAEQLKAQAQQLMKLTRLGSFSDTVLTDVAYTLQVGRNAMEERLCILAKTLGELENKLERFLRNGVQEEDIYLGHVKKIKSGSNVSDTTLTDKEIIDCIKAGDFNKIARLWTEGYAIPWNLFYTNEKPRRLSLPTYPFSKDVFILDGEYTMVASADAPTSQPLIEIEEYTDQNQRNRIHEVLMGNIARLLNMDVKNIALDENLDEYGFDSVLYTQFSIELNEQLGLDLTPIVFFQYPNLQQLSDYLAEEYPLALGKAGLLMAKHADAPTSQSLIEIEEYTDQNQRNRIHEVLIGNIARLLNMDVKNIALDENLDEYGFDSVLYTQFSIELNEQLGLDLTPIVFFQYPNLQQLSDYLAEEYPSVLGKANLLMASAGAPSSQPLIEIKEYTDQNQRNRIHEVLMGNIARLLNMDVKNIALDENLDEYGFDSVLYTQFSIELNEQLGLDLTPIVFFQYPNLQQLSDYLAEEYPSALGKAGLLKAKQVEKQNSTDAIVPTEQRLNGRQTNDMTDMDEEPAKTIADDSDPEAVAIIGLSLQFPMAKDADQFWDNLVQEKHCISEIPSDRWDWRDYPDLKIKWGGFMEEMDTFDPLFFKISPAEALQMDPNQRLLMQHIWKAIEDAGYNPHTLSGSNTGIFAGIICFEYSKLLNKASVPIASHSLLGMAGSLGPNRMSYFLNLHGPSMPIETACSSSLVAIHRAVEAIRSGNCDMALASGVNTLLTPDPFTSLHEAGALSPEGVCRPFSDQANGYVRGEGAGVFFLKRLKDAERDGDHIYGVIRSSAENHGGRANSLTSPNPKAQAALLHTAYTKAGIDPSTVTYIETHGTGTELGDPIEVSALKNAFSRLYQDNDVTVNKNKHCGIGSVKSNIGHLELAAGIAGVAKVLLQFKHKMLVKSLHSDRLNPYIDLSDGPFYVVTATEEWKAPLNKFGEELPRRAGVSSFGFGGVNAHIVLEEYVPKYKTPINNPASHLVVMSAKNNERLREYAQSLRDRIESKLIKKEDLASLAYTLQTGREHMEERFTVIVDSLEQLSAALNEFISGASFSARWRYGNIKNKQQEVDGQFNAANPLTKLAAAWIQGEQVDWDRLYDKQKPPRMSLPTYPFERKRYWPFDTYKASDESNMDSVNTYIHANEHNIETRAIAYFKSTISQLVKIPVKEIQETEMLIHYGVDSIAISRLLVKMKSVMPKLTNSVVFEHPTIAELVEFLLKNEPDGLQKLLEGSTKKAENYISGNSVVLLNDVIEGRPIFWFHPGGGGIDGYQHIAEASERPFYGIVADSWIREKKIIQGVPEMALFYLTMIQSVQPEGPYDLGGFSLGGALAYEVARQLQMQGHSVSTITMIDSIYIPELMGKFWLDYKTSLLQTVNLLLIAQEPRNGSRVVSRLIHRNELDPGLSDAEFLEQVTQLALQRGFTYPSAYVEAIVMKRLKVRDASRFTDYKVLPLSNPADVRCHYFFNTTRRFYGELAPYFILDDNDNIPIEKLDYWAVWEKHLVHFEKTALPATDHVTLMNDRDNIQPVIDCCKELYSSKHNNSAGIFKTLIY